ncbi:MAG: PIG-L family deacetylase [Lentisphaeria bacterium]|nr:PIG-L family deacetylase [Lentisphaeria bacterium]
MTKRAMAIGCHPDDIEFMMAGTLLKLQKAGYEIHYMTVASGSLGTNQYDFETIKRIRRDEAKAAAESIGAIYHESVCDDIEVFYNLESIGGVLKSIREVAPEIILTHGPYDYMEDHVCTGRLAVTAAFCRGMGNAKTARPSQKFDDFLTVYHAMPHSLVDTLRRPVIPGIFVNVEPVIEMKKQMLSCHKSQQSWLDVSQATNSYIQGLVDGGKMIGRLSKKYEIAEGWIRHNPVGFCEKDDDPLMEALGPAGVAFINEEFENAIKVDF